MLFRGGQKLPLIPSYLYDKFLAIFYRGAMKYCGKHVYLRPSSSDFKGLWNMSIGDYTSIPKGSIFYCTEAPCTIGKKVLFGPHPTIINAAHRIDTPGKYISAVHVDEKFVDSSNVYDQPDVIEEYDRDG